MNARGIEVADLHYSYTGAKGRFEALKGVSFSAPGGKITGLLGPNGSGKSTTFKVLSTQIDPVSGEATIAGASVLRERDSVRARIGVTFQSPSLDPMLTVSENLEIHASLVGLRSAAARTRINEMIDLFRLRDRCGTRVKELSGGLARRVELAKALLDNPPVLLLDEPTTGLDPALRQEFWQELRKLANGGMTLLVTTHLMDEADLCDQLVFLTAGRVAGQGTPHALKSEFGADVILLELSDSLEGGETWLRTKLGLSDSLKVDQGRFRIETQNSMRIIQELTPQLGERIRSLQWGKPTLADVYFSKTGQTLS
jgi:ABC-2 type transport system ATP-binding protein